MTREAQRIAIAETQGRKPGQYYCQTCRKCVHLDSVTGGGYSDECGHRVEYDLPDYLSDLNAMHEAEKVLTGNARDAYINYLVMRSISDGDSHVLFATAAQRAEAFLRTLKAETL